MSKLKTNLRLNLMVMLMAVMVAAIALVPMIASAQAGVPDLTGFYFAKLPSRGYDIDGTSVTLDYRYLGMVVSDTTEEGVVTGFLFGFNTTSVKGARVYGGGSTYNATIAGLGWLRRMDLEFGSNSINVTAAGTVGVYLPNYCEGTATSGTGTLERSPVSLAEGWTTLNVSAAGTISVAVLMSNSETAFAEVFGKVGEGSAAEFALFATDIVTDVDDTDDDVLVGVTEARVIMPSSTFVVDAEASGNVTIYMPYGTTGNVTASSCTVDGKASVDLVEGTNVILVVDAAGGGTITVNVITLLTFHWSGTVRGSEGDYRLQGAFNWFSLLDNYLIASGKLNARAYEDPLPR